MKNKDKVVKKIQLVQLNVSQIAFGTMTFGTQVNQQTSYKLLDIYKEKGGNFIDTSNNYAFWEANASGDESEELLGKWLKQQN